jgi:glucose PTS system EIICBA or EIICB component
LDLELIEAKVKSLISPVIITNMNIVESINVNSGMKNNGEKAADIIITAN